MNMPANSQDFNIPISDLFRDPRIAKAFRRAERDNGNAFAVPTVPKPVSPLGALVGESA